LEHLTKTKIYNFLISHKIKKNDTVFIHGNAAVIKQMYGINNKQKINFFWNSFFNYFAKNGTVIVPTFTYSLTKNKIFNPKKTISSIGLFSNTFRKLKFTKRTNHPIFSVSYFGKLSKQINKTSDETCFGNNSIYDLLYKKNAKLLCLGCSYNELTFMHFIEERLKIKYRYHKFFEGYYYKKNKKKFIKCDYFVKDLKYKKKAKLNLRKIMASLKKNKKYIYNPLGYMSAHSVKAQDLLTKAKKHILQNEHYLIN